MLLKFAKISHRYYPNKWRKHWGVVSFDACSSSGVQTGIVEL